MIILSDLYDYPVVISDEDFKNYTGYDLLQDIEAAERRNVLREFIDSIHAHVYDGLIYNCGASREIQSRIIERYRDRLEKPIKRALLQQGIYMLENGDISEWNGTTLLSGGQTDVKDSATIQRKIIAPKAVAALKSVQPNLLYWGE